jgi:hypothetical protein
MNTYASRATVHLQPVHHPGDFTHASLETKFRRACLGEVGTDVAPIGFTGLVMGRLSNLARPAVMEVADCESNLPYQHESKSQ